MAWDDTPPDTPAWDAAPPTAEELQPYGVDVLKNAGKELEALPGSIPSMAQQALGVASAPIDVLKSIPQALSGKDLAETDIGQDIKPIIAGNKSTLNTVEHPVESFRKAPINTTGTALGLMGIPELMKDLPEVPNVPRGTAPPVEPVAAAAESPKTAPLKDLPVMEPGTKTGPPHALFAYNDTFGPNGEPRSIYNVFGDPGHPDIHAVGGYGTSVPKDILDKAGIPIVGREPRSVGKWEPLDQGPAATPPAGEGIGAKPGSQGVPPPSGMPTIENAAKAAQDAAKEVQDYIGRTYQNYAKKPGAAADVADWVQAKSQFLAGQQAGITPKQFRDLGKTPLQANNAARAVGQYALDSGIVSPGTGLQGMLEKNDALIKSVGKTIGDYREMADKLDPGGVDPKEFVKAIRKELDSKYARGVTEENPTARGSSGGHYGSYLRALQDIEDAEGTHSGIADAVTTLNKTANKALKNMQPQGPFTDVANVASHLNDERVRSVLGADNAAKYEAALREFGVNKKIENGLRFKGSGEIKRFGPGSTASNLIQKGLDEFGYRFGAKVANKVSTMIKTNPSIAGSLPSLFKEFINQVEDVGHDVTGMSKGGQVPDDIKRFVASRP